MDEQSTTGDRSSDSPRGSRPKLHHVYFALAAFVLLTALLGLWLINRVTNIYTDSVAVNHVWTIRLSDFSVLGRLAAAVNAPGNDVFDDPTGVEEEERRLDEAVAAFNARVRAVRQDLAGNVDEVHGAALLSALADVDAAITDMAAEARLIFSHFRDGRPDLAGQQMARMDREYAKANDTLADLDRQVRAIQQAHFEDQTARARSVRKLEFLIAGLIVLMVVGVTLYGHNLARRMKRTAHETQAHVNELAQSRQELAQHRDHLEELVSARTAQLEASHEQLRLAERLASIGTLAAGLGHDMNNVLFPLRCQLDTIEATRLDEPARDELTKLRRSVEYLQQLSDGLRLLALDPDDDAATNGVTHLRTWSAEAAPFFQTALPKGAQFDLTVPDGLPPLAVAPHRLTQAVFNLVANAAEAIADQGRVRVGAELLEDGRFVRISVSDDGHGMSPEVRRQALDPFFTTKKRDVSTGLGLALVHGVAKSAGGHLEIDSAPGRGTTVAMSLPVTATPGAGGTPPEPARTAAVSVGDQRLATCVMALLRSAGFDVREPDTGEPGEAGLWVAEPACATSEQARRFLNGTAPRHVILLGTAPGDSWPRRGVTAIRTTAGVAEIQTAIAGALAVLPEAAP